MRKIIPVFTLLAGGACLAACGGSGKPATTASSNYSRGLQFASCMRSHGVPNFPDPKSGEGGNLQFLSRHNGALSVNGVAVNAPAFRSAMQACHSYLPNGGHPEPLAASRRQAMLQYAQCMRSHGVPSFPDPRFNGGGQVGFSLNPGSGVDPNSPAFQSAQKACASFQAKGFGRGPQPGGP